MTSVKGLKRMYVENNGGFYCGEEVVVEGGIVEKLLCFDNS